MNNLYYQLIEKHKKRMSFTVLVSFLMTFIIVRIYVLLGVFGIIRDPYLYIEGYHIHHLNYGIVIMALSGFFALFYQNAKNRFKIGLLYGIGLGLTFDEIGMWFKLEDDYWNRMSYDAIIVITLFFASIIYIPSFWKRIIHYTEDGIKILKNIKNNRS